MEDVKIIYTDGGQNKDTGDEAWGSVVDSNSQDLVPLCLPLFADMKIKSVKLPHCTRSIVVSKFNDVKTQQNNGAELLALVMALRMAKKYPNIMQINCDSDLLIKWWTKGGVNPVTKKAMDRKKLAYVEEATILRADFEARNGVLNKIPGKGNLADLGYHR